MFYMQLASMAELCHSPPGTRLWPQDVQLVWGELVPYEACNGWLSSWLSTYAILASLQAIPGMPGFPHAFHICHPWHAWQGTRRACGGLCAGRTSAAPCGSTRRYISRPMRHYMNDAVEKDGEDGKEYHLIFACPWPQGVRGARKG